MHVRKAWIVAVRRVEEDGSEWLPNENSLVCKAHFLASDYKETTKTGKKPLIT
jgi:hypothetical protein